MAGISGSGQKELLEAIAGPAGTQPEGAVIDHPPPPTNPSPAACAGGQGGEELVGKNSPANPADIGVSMAFVPEDRLGMGLVGSMGMADNMMLKSYRQTATAPLLDRKTPRKLAERVKEELEVVTPSRQHARPPALRRQRAEGAGGPGDRLAVPTVLMTAYAVRGAWTSTPPIRFIIC